MDKLKEYAGVIVTAVAVATALAALGLWAINAQVTPEINRLDGRIDNFESLHAEIKSRLDRMDDRIERRFIQMDDRFKQIDARFVQIDARFVQIDNRFVDMEGHINQRLDNLAATLNLVLARLPAPAEQSHP